MNSRTELLLYHLAWTLDRVMQPTWRNLHSSFESWAYGSGFLKQIQRLEAQAYIESGRDKKSGKRVIRLTHKGVAAARLGGDPEPRWQRRWDGKWRVILFDLPETERLARRKLREKLAASGFGCMQRSAWLSPDPMDGFAAQLRPLAVNAATLVLLDATPCGGESAADLVAAAWNFSQINRAWKSLAAHLDAAPQDLAAMPKGRVVRWVTKERYLLQRCLRIDPFLPKQLLPPTYQGIATWEKRRRILANLARRPA
jgi:phenylacetic acid degradation operon negative regulatory protein